ncbi:DUF488 domain-containing protein, partial [Streptomyces albidoflavus]
MSDEAPRVRRVYEPAEPSDGTRVLVDRLWPRGVSKERAAVDVWLKEITPSTELRDWYHQNPEERYDGFTERYRTELADPGLDGAEQGGGPGVLGVEVEGVGPH